MNYVFLKNKTELQTKMETNFVQTPNEYYSKLVMPLNVKNATFAGLVFS